MKIEDFGDSEASAEGASLANWTYQTFKADKKSFPTIHSLGMYYVLPKVTLIVL